MTTDRLSTTFAALADPTRRAILARLALGETSVLKLAEPFDMSLPAVSKHLKVLERAGLITRSRDAQMRPCRIEATALKEADDWLEEYRRLWEERLDRLDDYLRVAASEGEETWPQKIASTSKQDPRSIIGTRVFDAPRDLVFSAWTDPEASGAMVGSERLHHHDTFLRLSAGRRLALRHARAGRPRLSEPHHLRRNRAAGTHRLSPRRRRRRRAGAVHTTVTFEDLGNGQTRLTWHGMFPSAEERARVIREYGADKGLVQTMARLADYVAALAAERA